MSKFAKCSNGHYYDPSINLQCPYCQNDYGKTKIKSGMVQTPIRDDASWLRNEENVVFTFDTAPDGIKRCVEIFRRHDETPTIRKVAWMIGCDEEKLPSELLVKSEQLDTLVKKEYMKKNIVLFDHSPLITGEYYVSNKPIGAVVPDTILSQILGNKSKLDQLYEGDGVGYFADNQSLSAQTGALPSMGEEEFRNARKVIENKKYLSISLADNSKKVLNMPNRADILDIESVNDYYEEDISLFNPKVMFAEDYDYYEIKEYGVDTSAYRSQMKKMANHEYVGFRYRITRQNVANALLKLFEKVALLHKTGKAHCDLKPQNILCLKDGLTPIDGINVNFGDLSAGMTANYCAPEQVLARPVSPSTDIYNLGLIILSVIDGVLYGGTSSYIIPIGGNKVKKVRLLKEPMVYIDSDASNIEQKEGIVYWKVFLEKCLAFDPHDRFSDMDIFSEAYKELLRTYPLCNHIDFVPKFGSLSLIIQDGRSEAAWFINAE